MHYNDIKIELEFCLICNSDNIIYVARCNIFHFNHDADQLLYFGQTYNRLNVRLIGHRA
jgi:hypothetical protein